MIKWKRTHVETDEMQEFADKLTRFTYYFGDYRWVLVNISWKSGYSKVKYDLTLWKPDNDQYDLSEFKIKFDLTDGNEINFDSLVMIVPRDQFKSSIKWHKKRLLEVIQTAIEEYKHE